MQWNLFETDKRCRRLLLARA